MSPLAVSLVALPAMTSAATWYAARPAGSVPGGGRLALVRTAVIVASYAVVAIEVLSVFDAVTRVAIAIAWALAMVGALAAAIWRHRVDSRGQDGPGRGLLAALAAAARWPVRARLGVLEWLMVVGLVGLAGTTLAVALAAEPNNWDSQMYHLPKVEQWAANGSIAPYPVLCLPQVTLGPGAEYLLLHLRLLTGGDGLYNLVQWGGGVLAAVAASLVAARLGANRLGQFATAFVIATTPMVVLQATSTQTDLVAAAWCACVAVLAVDTAFGRLGAMDVALLGAAVGLAVLTKATGTSTAGVLMVGWGAARAWVVWRERSLQALGRLAGAGLGLVAAMALIIGPFLARTTQTFGHPLGPEFTRAHGMERHDPAAIMINGARLLQTVTMVGNEDINERTTRWVLRLADVLGENVIDPKTTRAASFPVPSYQGYDEDLAPYPAQVVIVGISLVFCLIWRRRDRLVVGYALTCAAVWIGFAGSIKWQWFANRLLLPGLVVAAPLAGLAFARVMTRRREALAQDGQRRRVGWYARRAAAATGWTLAAAAVIGLGTLGGQTVSYGQPRALVGEQSVLTTGDWETRFARQPNLLADYRWVAATIDAAGARRIGMVNGDSPFEYPLWVMLRDRELVNLQSAVPGHPAPSPESVDAIICFIGCSEAVPPNWSVHARMFATVILPPEGHDRRR